MTFWCGVGSGGGAPHAGHAGRAPDIQRTQARTWGLPRLSRRMPVQKRRHQHWLASVPLLALPLPLHASQQSFTRCCPVNPECTHAMLHAPCTHAMLPHVPRTAVCVRNARFGHFHPRFAVRIIGSIAPMRLLTDVCAHAGVAGAAGDDPSHPTGRW